MAKVVSEHTSMSAVMKPVGGDTILVPQVSDGRLHVYPGGAALAMVRAYKGDGEFEGKDFSNLRVLFQPFVLQALGPAVPASSNIYSISQLKGKRVPGVFPGQVSLYREATVFLAAGGLTWDEVTVVPVADMIENYNAMKEGRVDAIYALGATIPGVVELNAAIPLRVLSLGRHASEIPGFYDLLPGDDTVVVRNIGILSGVTEEIIGLWHPFWSYSSTDVSDDVAYEVVKAVYENYEELQSSHVLMKTFTPERMLFEPPIPYHPGAVRLYKEKGVWTDELDKVQQRLLKS